MTPRSTNRPTSRLLAPGESGIFVIILAGILISMLLILGLAVDSGTLYNGQLAAQSAADASVSAGAALLVERGPGADLPAISQSMDRMARSNLFLKGLPPDPDGQIQITPTIDPAAGIVRVSVATNVRLRILRLIPGFAQLSRVNAMARARIRPAVVSLILDTSYSMCCSAGGGPCNPSSSCPLAGSKLQDLQTAVFAFLEHFDPQRDSINLVPYALGADVVVPFQPLNQGFPKALIQQEVQNLVPGGATNPSDAFMRSYLDAARIGAVSRVAYVNFSDGAPTAARFFFNSDTLDPVVRVFHENNILGLPWSTHDFLSWALFSGVPGSYQSVPYFFVHTPSDQWFPRFHREALPPPEAVVIRRGPQPLGEEIETFSSLCMNMTLRLPDESAIEIGRGWDHNTHTWQWRNFRYREEYFNYALAIADFARRQGGAWYAIGLGDPAPLSNTPLGLPDPYQNVDQDFDRKDIFLTRLTNDSCGLVRGDPSFPGFSTYSQLAADGRHEGLYLATPASDELRSLFDTIARRIKLQLVE